MDLRIEKTRRSIVNAFIEIRAKKVLEKITIKELCEKAQINKSTFYSHYHDIYDLSEHLENEVVSSVIKSLEHPENIVKDPVAFNQEIFAGYIAKDSLINILFSDVRSSLLVEKIYNALKELIYQMYPQLRENVEFDIMLTYGIYGGYYAFYKNRKYKEEVVMEQLGRISTKLALPYYQDM